MGAGRASVWIRAVMGLYGSPSTAVLSFLTADQPKAKHFRIHIIIPDAVSVNAWLRKIFPM